MIIIRWRVSVQKGPGAGLIGSLKTLTRAGIVVCSYCEHREHSPAPNPEAVVVPGTIGRFAMKPALEKIAERPRRKEKRRKLGLINPNVFLERNLEYKIRFSRAPRLDDALKLLQGERNFNAYSVRGQYDVVVVSAESDHFLSRAVVGRRLEELQLRETLTFEVDEFVKYHGCMVPPRRKQEGAFYSPAILGTLFQVAKDWDSVPAEGKAALREARLLLEDGDGKFFEFAPEYGGPKGWSRRGTIVRLGVYGRMQDEAYLRMQSYLRGEVARKEIVRNCYTLKSPPPYLYILAAEGSPEQTDRFLMELHGECCRRFPEVRMFTRCEEVIRKVCDGNVNMLLTLQTRPDVLARAEEMLLEPFRAQMEDRDLIEFIEKVERIVQGISAPAVRESSLRWASDVLLALRLGSGGSLRESMGRLMEGLLELMCGRMARHLGCARDEETVITALKKRKLFQDHTATFGNVYPVYLDMVSRGRRGPALREVRAALEGVNRLWNRVSLRDGASSDAISASQKEETQDAFIALCGALAQMASDGRD